MRWLVQKNVDFEILAGSGALPDTDELHKWLRMSLVRLQLAFLHLPENDEEQPKFMVGLECKMVCISQSCHYNEAERSQNEIFLHFGATHQWQFPVEVHPRVVMCSCYIQSLDFKNCDTLFLIQFAEDFISTHPPLPKVHNCPLNNQWWTTLYCATFSSPMVWSLPIWIGPWPLTTVQFVEHQAQKKPLLDWLEIVTANVEHSIAFVNKMICTKKSQIVQLQTDCAAEIVLSNPADVDVQNSLCMIINEFFQQKGSAHGDAWTNTWLIELMKPQLTNPGSTDAQLNRVV